MGLSDLIFFTHETMISDASSISFSVFIDETDNRTRRGTPTVVRPVAVAQLHGRADDVPIIGSDTCFDDAELAEIEARVQAVAALAAARRGR